SRARAGQRSSRRVPRARDERRHVAARAHVEDEQRGPGRRLGERGEDPEGARGAEGLAEGVLRADDRPRLDAAERARLQGRQRRRSSSSASAPPATSASPRPARTRSAACPRATSPEAAPAVSVTDGPPRRYAMASSPAAAFDTVAAKRRGLAAAGPPSRNRR